MDLSEDGYDVGRRFESANFSDVELAGHAFEDCTFESCHFGETTLLRASFVNCLFESCDFVLSRLEGAKLNGARFRKSKLVGVNFAGASKFGFLPDFEDCLLDSSVFCDNCLKKVRFSRCIVRNGDFMECDIREAVFESTSLEGTDFHKCNLEKADLTCARDYSIDPATNRLARARFSLPEAQSFLGFLGIILE